MVHPTGGPGALEAMPLAARIAKRILKEKIESSAEDDPAVGWEDEGIGELGFEDEGQEPVAVKADIAGVHSPSAWATEADI